MSISKPKSSIKSHKTPSFNRSIIFFTSECKKLTTFRVSSSKFLYCNKANMGKASVILYITVGILVLFLVSYSPKKKSDHDHHHGGQNQHHRLKLRSSFNFKPTRHDPVPFDPLVADMERRREDKEWERQYIEHSHPDLASHSQKAVTGDVHDHAPGHESQPEWEDFMDAEDYLNNEDKFNVTDRLIVLFPKLDVSPVDGFVTESELTEWNMQSSAKEVMHRTQRDLDVHDKNKDGFISFSEYEPPSWVRNSGEPLLDLIDVASKELVHFHLVSSIFRV